MNTVFKVLTIINTITLIVLAIFIFTGGPTKYYDKELAEYVTQENDDLRVWVQEKMDETTKKYSDYADELRQWVIINR